MKSLSRSIESLMSEQSRLSISTPAKSDSLALFTPIPILRRNGVSGRAVRCVNSEGRTETNDDVLVIMLSVDLELLVVIGQTYVQRYHATYRTVGHRGKRKKARCYGLMSRKWIWKYEISGLTSAHLSVFLLVLSIVQGHAL